MAGPTPLIKKLRLDSEKRVLLINPPDTFAAALGTDLSALNCVTSFEEGLEFVLIFAHFKRQILDVMPQVQQSLVEDGLLWLAYPKKSSKVESDLSRDVFWDLVSEYGYRPVTQISIDEVWSGLRFRPAHLVGK